MIRFMVHLGAWLDKRFPEKIVITVKNFSELEQQIDLLNKRVSVVEQAAVHKEAVATLITHVQQLKDEVSSLKTGLGMNRIGDSEIRAMLNGQPISQGDQDNG